MKWFGSKQSEKVLLNNNEIACGIVQHPITGRWQTWMSFHGTDIGCVTAHKSREDADNVARQIVAAWESGLEDKEKVAEFMLRLPSDDVPDPLPQDVVVRLSKKIRSHCVTRTEIHKAQVIPSPRSIDRLTWSNINVGNNVLSGIALPEC